MGTIDRGWPASAVDGRTQSERPVTAFPLVTGIFPLVWQVQGSNLRRLSRRFYRPGREHSSTQHLCDFQGPLGNTWGTIIS
jgi:hypothetical protein